MTDTVHYKNVSLKIGVYNKLDKVRENITPHTIQSRSGTIEILVNKEMARLNGKTKPREK